MQLFSFISTSVKLETRNPLSVKNFFEPASFKNNELRYGPNFILFYFVILIFLMLRSKLLFQLIFGKSKKSSPETGSSFELTRD